MILLNFFFNNNYPVFKDYYPSYTSRFTSCTFHIIEPSEIAKFVIEIIDIRMFYKFNLTCFLLIVAGSLSAQTKIGGDPFVINDGSILELEDTERGVLFPRIVLDNVSQWTLLGSPVDGMVIVNEGGVEPEGVYHWNDGAWQSMSGMTSETVTTIVDNLDGTFTYTNEAGNQVTVFSGGTFKELIYTAVLEGAVLTSGSSVNETLWGPRMISIPFDQRDTYLFIPRNPNGGVATIKASGWQQEHWYGLLTWTDNGNGLAGAAIDTVTLTSLSTSGDLSMTAAVSTANNQAIVFTFTGVHVNAHGWNFTIID